MCFFCGPIKRLFLRFFCVLQSSVLHLHLCQNPMFFLFLRFFIPMIKRGLNWLFCCRGGASTFYKLAVIDALLAHLAMVLFIFLCVWKKDGRTYYPRPHTPLMTRRSTATVEASHASLSASERGRDIPRLFSVVGAFPRFFLSVITSLNFQIFFVYISPSTIKKKKWCKLQNIVCW